MQKWWYISNLPKKLEIDLLDGLEESGISFSFAFLSVLCSTNVAFSLLTSSTSMGFSLVLSLESVYEAETKCSTLSVENSTGLKPNPFQLKFALTCFLIPIFDTEDSCKLLL